MTTVPDVKGRTSTSTSLDIELKNVTLQFPKPDGAGMLTVFENFDLDVEQGSFTVLLGPSGCGKSTLLNVMDGLLEPPADHIRILGQDIRKSADVTRQIAHVFQSPRLLRWKTLRGNVTFALKGLQTQPKERWNDLIENYFRVVGLSDYLDFYPHQVSGGMQQRAAIVRAWVNEPRILLMDEPFSHLDEITAAEMRRELTRLWTRDEPRRTIVFVTHDIKEAVKLGTHVVMLTPRPARICHTQEIDLPWPREDTDDPVFELERDLRRIFAERAGIRT
jgi:ABC-type nitrate/sulfonate/bicarbonate transport system ATPase subunit